MKESIVLEDDGYCFVCGMKNPFGLRLEWITDDSTTTAYFVPEKKFQGYVDIMHGGITATLLDEAMTRLVWEKFGRAVSAEMSIRYIKPIGIGSRLEVKGEILDQRKRIVYTRGQIILEDGSVAAKAEGKSVLIG